MRTVAMHGGHFGSAGHAFWQSMSLSGQAQAHVKYSGQSLAMHPNCAEQVLFSHWPHVGLLLYPGGPPTHDGPLNGKELFPPPSEMTLLDPELPSGPLLLDELPELPPEPELLSEPDSPPDDEDVASFTPASPVSAPLFEPEPPQPAERAAAVPSVARAMSARCRVESIPSSRPVGTSSRSHSLADERPPLSCSRTPRSASSCHRTT
jgi:hypothetical protein